MNKYLFSFKKWYESRENREKLLIILLIFVLLYGIFYYLFLRQLETTKINLNKEIVFLNNQINDRNLQINALHQLAESPLYKQWRTQNKAISDLHGKYTNILQSPSFSQLQNVIKIILESQQNVTVVQITNEPEKIHAGPTSSAKIYEQRLQVVLFSNYFDTLNYIKDLETLIPNLYWENLNYQVVEYPVAKVEMEFSLFYEKTV